MTPEATAISRIEQARADNATELDLSELALTALPEQLGQLGNLQTLYLADNQLTALPEQLGQLGNLQYLDLQNNQLTALPEQLGQLGNLQHLDLHYNQLTALPEQLGQLGNLQYLYLQNNQLTALPEQLGQLGNLQILYLNNNQLTALPEQLGQLGNLQILYLNNNQLPDALMAAFERGLDDFRTYLQGMAEEQAELLYEAKLVLVGDGGVGKSSLLAALQGLPFESDRKTTHGIDIVELPLPHPEAGQSGGAADEPKIADGTKISIRAWDFGGQPEYRVTHQFFYSERTLYVLVWNSRLELEAQNSRVEHWLKHIRRRVGQNIRVLIVATHCQAESNDRTPNVDQYGLTTRHPGIIAGFYNVDSENGYGIKEVKQAIAREAASLPQMGDPMPPSWKAARDEVVSQDGPLMFHDEFVKVCKSHELTDQETETLSALMNDLGQIIHFRDDPTLRGVVVRQPDWLSKAIGLVIDDKATIDSNGILDHRRLREIWDNPARNDSERYTNALLYPYFLKLMHEFDVSYGIDPDSSLIAQLISTEKPGDRLPWEHHDDPPAGEHRRQLVVDIQDDPPGLMPWLIVRNHRFIKEPIHWSQGVFLESDEFGQALVELIDRRLFLTVRHFYPQTFMANLQGSVTEVLKNGRAWPASTASRCRVRQFMKTAAAAKDCSI
jgi:internalin A